MKYTFSFCLLAVVLLSCHRERDKLIDHFQSNGMLYYLTVGDGLDERDSLSKDSAARIELMEIALDTSGHSLASFIASEILLCNNQPVYYSKNDEALLSNLYLRILASKSLADTLGNIWAVPCFFSNSNGIGDGFEGEAGKHLLAFGKPAIRGLIAMLNDTTHMLILGPGDGTTYRNNLRGYRVKDIAAYLLCNQKGLVFHGCNEPAMRDQEIEELKKKF